MKTIKDSITNKKVVFYGDSITHNWEKYDHDLNLTHKDDINYKYGLGYGHVKMLNDVCHFKSVDNFAVSGGCYASCSQINPNRPPFRHFAYQIMHSLDKLKEAEVIFVMFGSNDYSEQVPFGKEDDIGIDENQEDMTFYGGMNFGFKKIKEINPTAKIYVINCLSRTVDIEKGRTFNYSLNEYNLAIQHICRIYDLTLIDVSKLYKVPQDFIGENKVSDDGLHPNQKGYKLLTNYILNQVEKD